ncbi:MAG: AmmeMemoRadiSam system protein B [Kiritimatiellae bacterium]|nr:AmmeMemoRadiSam system protein B [Kiritimatiellia bacterium]
MNTNAAPFTYTSTLAGSWYTADERELRRELRAKRAASGQTPDSAVFALILPHAGYQYSGAVAAHGARMVEGRSFSRVIVMGPTHRVPMRNAIATPDADAYATILGSIPIDVEFVGRLRRYPLFRTVRGAMPGEHSIEIEFPLLQDALGEFRLVPLVVGQLDDAAVTEAAACLRAEMDSNTLVVASTDFTHYGPRFDYVPFTGAIETKLRELDLGAFEFIRRRDAVGFRRYIDRTGATICGRDPVAVLTAMLPEDAEVRLLAYDTSGRITGDWLNSVSYLSAAIRCRWTPRPLERPAEPAPKSSATEEGPLQIPEPDRAALLSLARSTIRFYFAHQRRATPAELGVQITPAMRQVAGAFVTLHKHGELRGCIGEILPTRALYAAVMDQALNAAFRDPRFPPLQELELPLCRIEISALSEPKPVSSWSEIVLGRHGIILRKEGHTALFLPQVAPQQGWDLPTTLRHLALKAGLAPDDWRSGADFEVFEAVVFGESDA